MQPSSPFPRLDTIPLPAPVWLFKVLHDLTTVLHFVAVQLLLGGLLLAVVWAFWGRKRQDEQLLGAANSVAKLLPIVMIYVINLGVPPLLFAQVLYGPALYTSSVLIGMFWISVIFLLMLVYSLLYFVAGRAEKGRPWVWGAVVSLVVAAGIAFIYNSNMTLMLRPGVWAQMYRADPHGLHLNTGDPTVLPRWLYALSGGVAVGGAGVALLAAWRRSDGGLLVVSRLWSPWLVLVGAVGQLVCGLWAYFAQPGGVRETLWSSAWPAATLVLWLLLTIGLVVLAHVARLRWRGEAVVWPLALAAGCLAETVGLTLARSSIRDAALAAAGFQVWDRAVAANWAVVILFVLSLLLAVVAVVWLTTIAVRAKGAVKSHA